MCYFLKLQSIYRTLDESGVSNLTLVVCVCGKIWKNSFRQDTPCKAESGVRGARVRQALHNTVLKCIDRRILHQKQILSEVLSLTKLVSGGPNSVKIR